MNMKMNKKMNKKMNSSQDNHSVRGNLIALLMIIGSLIGLYMVGGARAE